MPKLPVPAAYASRLQARRDRPPDGIGDAQGRPMDQGGGFCLPARE